MDQEHNFSMKAVIMPDPPPFDSVEIEFNEGYQLLLVSQAQPAPLVAPIEPKPAEDPNQLGLFNRMERNLAVVKGLAPDSGFIWSPEFVARWGVA